MAQQLKRWESPRRKGRNHKGRGGSAKAKQYKKRQQQLRKHLQANSSEKKATSLPTAQKSTNPTENQKTKRRESISALFFIACFSDSRAA